MDDERPNFAPNPPGYGEIIGGVVLLDPPDAVIEAALRTYWEDWHRVAVRNPGFADTHRKRMRAALMAAVRASV